MISENNYQMGIQNLKAEYETTMIKYQSQLQTVKYFEEIALQNATIIINTANAQFLNGDINYLEWVMMINSAANIQSNYTDAIRTLNTTIIHLNYLTTN